MPKVNNQKTIIIRQFAATSLGTSNGILCILCLENKFSSPTVLS
jgi:hypothetical protein